MLFNNIITQENCGNGKVFKVGSGLLHEIYSQLALLYLGLMSHCQVSGRATEDNVAR